MIKKSARLKMADDADGARIAEYFPVPARVADQLRHVVKKTRGGYVLSDMRPHWNDPKAPWVKSPIARIVGRGKIWKVYWMPSSMRWMLYGEYKSLGRVLRIIDEDKNGCFWG